jgi:hypothetical protein
MLFLQTSFVKWAEPEKLNEGSCGDHPHLLGKLRCGPTYWLAFTVQKELSLSYQFVPGLPAKSIIVQNRPVCTPPAHCHTIKQAAGFILCT